MNYSDWYHGVNNVTLYSQSGNVTLLAKMNTGRRGHGCTTFVTETGDTAVMVISGGGPDRSLTATVEILMDLLDGTWSPLAPLPIPRFYLQAVTLNNIVYAIGGATYTDKYIYYGEVYSLSSLSQTSWDNPRNVTPRAFHIAAIVANENFATLITG